ncbi:MAG: hypothetical protein M8861_13380 [marine benthic group bacterium]|jgi:hypothetical protein|nr:hypothetical protein [Gemmatimonadota bacterium]
MVGKQEEGGQVGRWFFYGGFFWLALAALAFWAYFTGSAPFDTLGIPVSQLVLAVIFFWIGWRGART